MYGHPVVIRTIDVGGDKPIAGLGFAHEDNPFLGWRGARLFLYGKDAASPNRDPEMRGQIEAQLGAILRAGADGEVRLMWPMIASVEEIETLHGLLDEARARLTAHGVGFGKVRVGAMIETPGAAMVADKLAQKLDFFSIGSNDLTQYALAADRGNERISPIYQPFHPGVWRLIANVIEAGHRGSIPVALCGELAGTEEAALPLLGLGLDEFSMAAPLLPRITLDEAKAVAQAVLDAPTAAVALSCARSAMQKAIERGR
jgi:phosphotransferase system enzyme I (PtsI)